MIKSTFKPISKNSHLSIMAKEEQQPSKQNFISSKTVVPSLEYPSQPQNIRCKIMSNALKSKSPKSTNSIFNKPKEPKKTPSNMNMNFHKKKKSFNINNSSTTNDLSLLNDIVSKSEFNNYDSSFVETDKHKKDILPTKKTSKTGISDYRKFSILDIKDSNLHNVPEPKQIIESKIKKTKKLEERTKNTLTALKALTTIKLKCAFILAKSK